MKVVNITFTVLAVVHSSLILWMVFDLVYAEYIMQGGIGIHGFARRITILIFWTSLIAISVVYFLLTTFGNSPNRQHTKTNWLIAGAGVSLGTWVALPFLLKFE